VNPDEMRDAADRAAELLDAATPGPWTFSPPWIVNADMDMVASGMHPEDPDAELIAAAPDLLAVLGPAARQLADLLDAVGDPEELRCVETDDDDFARYLRRIADAAAAARGEG
jgi:hypothetical protein